MLTSTKKSDNKSSLSSTEKIQCISKLFEENKLTFLCTNDQKIQALVLLKYMREIIFLESQAEIDQLNQYKSKIIDAYKFFTRRIFQIPQEIAQIPALDIISNDFSFQNSIMFGRNHASNTALDQDEVRLCCEKIIKYDRIAKIKGNKENKTLKVMFESKTPQKQEVEEIDNKEVSRRALNHLKVIQSRSADISKMNFFSKSEKKTGRWVGKSTKKEITTAGRVLDKKFKSANRKNEFQGGFNKKKIR